MDLLIHHYFTNCSRIIINFLINYITGIKYKIKINQKLIMAKEHLKKLIKGDDVKGGDIIEFFEGIIDNFNLPVDIKFYYQANSKLKQLLKLTKIPDSYSVAIGKDIMIQVSEEYFDTLDDKAKTIIIETQIDRIDFNLDKGTFKLGIPKVSTNPAIIDKYTWEEVNRAIILEKEYESQKKDKES